APGPAPSGDGQGALALDEGDASPPEPVEAEDMIRALNFPDTRDDTAGFRALRTALQDPALARVIRAAQDVLTLLSEDGIYMDNLGPDRARPEVWRQFAHGARGGSIAALGGVHDRDALAIVAERLRADPVFRDAAHHFLRQFDTAFEAFEREASDQQIAAFAETRTARAFMLTGRAVGMFD
ncbi:hypothetical protein C2I36_09695, partial [Rhodobacteraceae bacterium WD3A24]